MPHNDAQAVPSQISVVTGVERAPDEWSEAIAGLRFRMLALEIRDLQLLMRELQSVDLINLVVSVPYDHTLLARLEGAIQTRAWEMLRDDCEKQGTTLLGDLALGVYTRVNEALAEIDEVLAERVAAQATKEQQAQLLSLSRQMLALDDNAFKFCINEMHYTAMNALFVVTGGLDSDWSQRARQFISDRAWAMTEEDYPHTAAESINADIVIQCIENLPAMMVGQPWKNNEEQADEKKRWEEFQARQKLKEEQANEKKGWGGFQALHKLKKWLSA